MLSDIYALDVPIAFGVSAIEDDEVCEANLVDFKKAVLSDAP